MVNHKLDPLNVSAPGGRIGGVEVGGLASGGTIMALFDVANIRLTCIFRRNLVLVSSRLPQPLRSLLFFHSKV